NKQERMVPLGDIVGIIIIQSGWSDSRGPCDQGWYGMVLFGKLTFQIVIDYAFYVWITVVPPGHYQVDFIFGSVSMLRNINRSFWSNHHPLHISKTEGVNVRIRKRIVMGDITIKIHAQHFTV